MGRPKLLLPLSGSTVLEHALLAVQGAGIANVLVVVAPDAEELAQRADAAGAHVLRLAVDTPDMRSTCLHGLARIEAEFHPHNDDGWLLLPADHPTVRGDVVQALLSAAQDQPDKTIVVPTHAGRRGHPTWLRWSHVAGIRALPGEKGLNEYIRAHASETLEIPWPTDEILRDLDTPEDYQRMIDTRRAPA